MPDTNTRVLLPPWGSISLPRRLNDKLDGVTAHRILTPHVEPNVWLDRGEAVCCARLGLGRPAPLVVYYVLSRRRLDDMRASSNQ
jgi:hypothetical protein